MELQQFSTYMPIWHEHGIFFLPLSQVCHETGFPSHTFPNSKLKKHNGHINVTRLNLGLLFSGQSVRIVCTTKLGAVAMDRVPKAGVCTLAVLLRVCSCEFMGQPECPHRSASNRAARYGS